jgi:hypothetical protein
MFFICSHRQDGRSHAWLTGMVPHVRCLRGPRDGPAKIEPCGYRAALSLETLLWTRGARFPVGACPVVSNAPAVAVFPLKSHGFRWAQ